MHKLNPRLVYCAVSGYGERGPLKDKAGYDQVLQAMTGICAMQGSPDDPHIVYGSVVDYYAAALLAGSVASALYARESTGEGQFVGISLLRSALAMQSARLVWAEGEDRTTSTATCAPAASPASTRRARAASTSLRTRRTSGAALCELIGLPTLAADPRYDTVRKRAQHPAEIVPRIRDALRARTALEWEQHFGERVPCSAVREVEDMFEHEQVHAESMIATLRAPDARKLPRLYPALGYGRTPGPSRSPRQRWASTATTCAAR